MTQDAMAREAAKNILADLLDRGGIQNAFDCLDQEIMDDIASTMAGIISRAITEARPDPGAGTIGVLQAIYDDHMANVEGGTRLSLHALAYVTGALAVAEKPKASAGERRFRLTDGGRNGVGVREIYSDSPDPNDRPDLWFATARHFDVAREIVAALGGVMVEDGQ